MGYLNGQHYCDACGRFDNSSAPILPQPTKEAATTLAEHLSRMIDWLDDGRRQLSDSCAAEVRLARAALVNLTTEAR